MEFSDIQETSKETIVSGACSGVSQLKIIHNSEQHVVSILKTKPPVVCVGMVIRPEKQEKLQDQNANVLGQSILQQMS